MKWHIRLPFVIAFALLVHLASCMQIQPMSAERLPETVATLTGKAHVYDGDSIFFGKVEVRLSAIDAPELDQACKNKENTFWPCGVAARDALRKMVADNDVRCAISGRR